MQAQQETVLVSEPSPVLPHAVVFSLDVVRMGSALIDMNVVAWYRTDVTTLLAFVNDDCAACLTFKTGPAVARIASALMSEDKWRRVNMATGPFEYMQRAILMHVDPVHILTEQYLSQWSDPAPQEKFYSTAVIETVLMPDLSRERVYGHPLTGDWAARQEAAINADPGIRYHRYMCVLSCCVAPAYLFPR